jgi:hypothetical protein
MNQLGGPSSQMINPDVELENQDAQMSDENNYDLDYDEEDNEELDYYQPPPQTNQ